MSLPRETIYGARTKYEWFKRYLRRGSPIVDLGCGTGWALTLPLALEAYDVFGVDPHAQSIDYGRAVFRENGLDERRLVSGTLSDLTITPDVVILNEVLEHLTEEEIGSLLSSVHHAMSPSGHILVSAPRGYGWFELESLLWFKLRLGRLLKLLWIVDAFIIAKNRWYRTSVVDPHPGTFDESPHVQRFSMRSLSACLARAGFQVLERRGGVWLCGPFTDLFFTGVPWAMRMNVEVGRRFPWMAADLYVAARKPTTLRGPAS